jgi:hypothetical protein
VVPDQDFSARVGTLSFEPTNNESLVLAEGLQGSLDRLDLTSPGVPREVFEVIDRDE